MEMVKKIFYYYQNWNTNNTEIDVYLSKGKQFVNQHHICPSTIGKLTTADFNGDGKQEIFDQQIISFPSIVFSFFKDGQELLLQKLSDGMNRLVEFQYKPLTEGGNLYTKLVSSSYPYRDVQPALNVVKKIKTDNGIGNRITSEYRYEGAVFNLEGKGFLGFTTTKVIENGSQRWHMIWLMMTLKFLGSQEYYLILE